MFRNSILVALLAMSATACTSVEDGTVGAKQTFGSYSESILEPGLNFYVPFFQSVTSVDVSQHPTNLHIEAMTNDKQELDIESLTVTRMPKTNAVMFLRDFPGFYESILTAEINKAVRDVIPHYDASDVNEGREKLSTEIEQSLVTSLSQYGVEVLDFSLTSVRLDEQFMQAVRDKQTAEQAALKAAFDLQSKQKAAELRLTEAEITAKATRTQADAQAYEIEAVGKALRQNPDYMSVKQIERWNGQLPVTLVTDGTKPLLSIK